jgi:hypothetical protein
MFIKLLFYSLVLLSLLFIVVYLYIYQYKINLFNLLKSLLVLFYSILYIFHFPQHPSHLKMSRNKYIMNISKNQLKEMILIFNLF